MTGSCLGQNGMNLDTLHYRDKLVREVKQNQPQKQLRLQKRKRKSDNS